MKPIIKRISSYLFTMLITVTLILLVFVFWQNERLAQVETKKIIRGLSDSSNYKLVQYQKGKAIILGYGSLGRFYNCIKNYKGSGNKNSKGGVEEPAYYLVFDKSPSIKLLVNTGEAYLFSPEVNNFTGIYSINCDLGLLNKQ